LQKLSGVLQNKSQLDLDDMRIRPTEIDYGAGDDAAVDVEETQDGLKVRYCLVRRHATRQLIPCVGTFC
jgi:hypothetical protein